MRRTVVNRLYYKLKPWIPRVIQLGIRRSVVRIQKRKHGDVWPIDERAAIPPEGSTGWPEGKRFALVLTHDVDTERGVGRCRDLAVLEEGLGVRSSFNFVPERYKDCAELRAKVAITRPRPAFVNV